MNWPTAQLGDVCEIVSGATPKTGTPAYWDGDVVWATPKDLSDLGQKHLDDTPRKLTRLGHESCSAAMLPPQSVLLSSRAPIGLVAINTIPVCTNQGFKSLVPRNGSVNADYLYWWLKCNNAFLQSLGRGATFKEVSKAIVSRIEIPLPPLAEQKRIAGILDAADALRAKRREALAQLDTLLQATFLDLFGDPVTNPKEWLRKPLEDVLHRDRPISYGILKPGDYEQNGIIMLRIQDIRGGQVRDDELHRVPTTLSQQYKRTLLSGGEIVISLVGTIGLCALVPPRFSGSNVHRNLAVIAPSESIDSTFLFQQMTSDRFQHQIRETTKGGNQPLLNLGDLKKLPVLVPPIDVQKRFRRFFDSLGQQKVEQRKHLAELDTLFASLQSRAFRGEL